MGQVTIFSGVERRRRWSEDAKRALVMRTLAPGAVVVRVAMEADVRPNQLYRWRAELRRCGAKPDGGFAQVARIVGLLLTTGARQSELLKAKWSDIDLAKRTWTMNMAKNGRGRHVPLSQAAMDIIGKLRKYPDCPWLLPNPQTMLPFTYIKRSFMEKRKKARLNDMHIHGLRHSYASALVNAEIDLHQIGSLLGHRNVASTQCYEYANSSTLMAAAETGAAELNVNW